jgi:uncharacterized membrane protein YidH (DUF202 family)
MSMKFENAHVPPKQVDSSPKQECEVIPEGIIINEVQLILAEKRTSLSTMRTGITVFVLPLSVLSVLIATSKYYDVFQVMHLIVPLLIICAALVVLGSYLIIRSIIRIRHQDNIILQLKRKHMWISEYID